MAKGRHSTGRHRRLGGSCPKLPPGSATLQGGVLSVNNVMLTSIPFKSHVFHFSC